MLEGQTGKEAGRMRIGIGNRRDETGGDGKTGIRKRVYVEVV